MKKNILLIAVILMKVTGTFSQITLNYTYTSDLPDRSVKLALSGLKYVNIHETGSTINSFTLYNPDHSIFKIITVPIWNGKNTVSIAYVSETLFDLDTLIEYYTVYSDGNTNAMRICNENGLVLLQRDSANIAGAWYGVSEDGFINGGIFPNGNATKLMIRKGYGISTTVEIYELPGRLACLECDNGVVSGLIQQPNFNSANRNATAYPNPFTNNIKIKYSLPSGVKHASINLFDIAGNLVKKKEIDNHFNEVIITSDEIKQGAYIYQIVADDKIIANDKIIKL